MANGCFEAQRATQKADQRVRQPLALSTIQAPTAELSRPGLDRLDALARVASNVTRMPPKKIATAGLRVETDTRIRPSYLTKPTRHSAPATLPLYQPDQPTPIELTYTRLIATGMLTPNLCRTGKVLRAREYREHPERFAIPEYPAFPPVLPLCPIKRTKVISAWLELKLALGQDILDARAALALMGLHREALAKQTGGRYRNAVEISRMAEWIEGKPL